MYEVKKTIGGKKLILPPDNSPHGTGYQICNGFITLLYYKNFEKI
jgi:hypothetical protein